MTGTPTLYLSIIHSSTRVSRFGRVKSTLLKFYQLKSFMKVETYPSLHGVQKESCPLLAWIPPLAACFFARLKFLLVRSLCQQKFTVYTSAISLNFGYQQPLTLVQPPRTTSYTHSGLSLYPVKKAKNESLLQKAGLYTRWRCCVSISTWGGAVWKNIRRRSRLLKCQKDLVHLNFVRNVENGYKATGLVPC